jgi:hypothetical protein
MFTGDLPARRGCCDHAGPLRHVTGFPGLGLLRALRPTRAASADDGPSCRPAGRWPGRGPPGVGVGPERPAVSRSVGFSGPPSEPDVRLSPHPALHEPIAVPRPHGLSGSWLVPGTQCPSMADGSPVFTGGSWLPDSTQRVRWTPSPCAQLSCARTTTGPPPHPVGIDQQRVFPPNPPRWTGTGPTGWFPRSCADRSTGEVPSFAPAASPRLRRRPSPWPPRRRTIPTVEFVPPHGGTARC